MQKSRLRSVIKAASLLTLYGSLFLVRSRGTTVRGEGAGGGAGACFLIARNILTGVAWHL